MAATLMAFALTACGDDDDDDDEYGPSMGPIELSQSTVNLAGNGASTTVYVNNATVARVETSASWLDAYVPNSSSVKITAQANNTGKTRSTFVYVYSTDKRSTAITVNQENNSGGNTPNPNPNPNPDPDPDPNPNPNPGTQVPAAPTNLYVSDSGSAAVPNCILRWDASAGATSYIIYRSTRESGSYSQIGTSQYNSYADQSVKVGNTYYYRVKAKNSKGTSDYSNTCKYEFSDTRKPGPAKITSASCSGSMISVRWSVPSDASYGKPTSAALMVSHPDNGKAVELNKYSGTATSASFNYQMWVNSITGGVTFSIRLINEHGYSDSVVIYDTKNKKFYYN